MKNNKIQKILICFMTTMLLITGSLFSDVNKNDDVYAEVANPLQIVKNKIIIGAITVNMTLVALWGKTYQIPSFLVDAIANPTNISVTSNVANAIIAWDDFVKTGVIDSDKWQDFFNVAKDKVTGVYYRAYNLINNAIINGTANETVNDLIDIMMGAKDVVTYIADGERISANYKDTSLISRICDYLDKVLQETSSKFYYQDHDNNDNFNDGTVAKQPIYNDNTKQIYDSYNRTYNDVDNYSYNFNTSEYVYSTDSGDYYVKNFNNYTNVEKLLNGVTSDYKLYYKLPDGSNSFNLNENNILGYRTDFNVDNYNLVNNNPYLDTLCHFNNDFTDEISGQQLSLDIDYGNNFSYVNDIWGSALFVNKNTFYMPYLDFMGNDYGTYTIKFMPSFNSNFNMNIRIGDNNTQLGKQIEITENYEQKIGTQSATTSIPNKYIDDNGETKTIITVRNSVASQAESQCRNRLGGTVIGDYYSDGDMYCVACSIAVDDYRTIHESATNQTTTYNYTQWFLTQDENEIYTGQGSKIIYDGWNTLTIEKNYRTKKIYLNGNLINTVISDDDPDISINQDGYTLLDEMAIFTYDDISAYHANSNIHFLPFSSGNGYAIPSDLTNANNLILIQSQYTINNWQIGGLRTTNASTGDVYIAVNDNNVISNVEQYNGRDWIEIKGAIYNDTIGKWVDIIGFSLDLGDFDYVDIPIVDDVETDFSLINKLNEIKETIINKINEIISVITGNGGNEIIIDNEIVNENNPSVTINDYFNRLINLFNNTYDDVNDHNDFSDFTNLASSVNRIFDVIDENNMEIIYLAPIIVLVLRLVI